MKGRKMTKDFAESLAQIVADVGEKHSSDIDAAVDECERRVKRLNDFKDFIGDLVRQALREQIHTWRHRANVAQRKSSGFYGGVAKVVAAASEAVADAASEKSLYDYFVAGTVLGELTGEQLPGIASGEREKADGHAFNADLCEALAAIVPEGKTVREAVKEGKLRTIFMGILKGTKQAA
jgi:hypothetical protein